MGILGRAVLREVLGGAVLGTVLFTFVLFLQKLGSGQMFATMLRGTATPSTVGYVFALVIPPTLPFAIPIGVLVGVLLGLGRMSGDGEITAMRAAGVPSRKVIAPVLVFALFATALAASASLWLTPLSIRETYRILNRLIAEQLTAEIQPRVFEEQFTNNNTILYVGDVIAGPVVRWRNIFIADLTPPGERSSSGREVGPEPRITIASEAIAIADVARNRIQLSMTDGSSHEVDKDPAVYYSTAFPRGDQVLEARPRGEASAKAYISMDTAPLIVEARQSVEARIELHQRFALPLACLLLALIGIPIGVSSRKAGKSGAFVLTVLLAFLYYMGLISLIGLARQGRLPVEAAVWTPNLVLAVLGVLMLTRLDRPGDRDLMAGVRRLPERLWSLLRAAAKSTRLAGTQGVSALRLPMLPQIIDTYVLNTFLFYFALLLASFVAMTHIFTFFELLSDILTRQIPMSRVVTYHVFLTPKLIYDTAPMSVLVAVLVTFGILTKHNEVTAMKACGVSLFRLSVPVLLASTLLGGALFAFDHYYIPEANRIQDGIRNEIKGRPVQTYLRPDRKWIFGAGSRIYYYKYFDPDNRVMVGVNVYELDPRTFRLTRHISAESARWEPSLKSWIFQNGWRRDLKGVRVTSYETFLATTFPELDETPGYFLKEVKQEKQLNFHELDSYIRDLRQSGFDTIRMQVQFHKKFSVPAFALVMALISVPFAFLTGSRGAMAGVGVSFGIAIAYYASSRFFEEVGNLAQLPPALAAWSPVAVFAFAGLYLFSRMRT